MYGDKRNPEKKYTVPFDQRFIINQQSDQQMVTCVNGKTTTA